MAAISTCKDTAKVGPVPCGGSLPGLRVPHHHILATDRVYFVGHPVAVVVATDKYLARDAAEKIEVDWEVLPAVADPGEADRRARRRCIRSGPTTFRSTITRKAAMWTKRSPRRT